MSRLDTYCKLLENIYGKGIVQSFTTRDNSNQWLTMNDEANNQKEKKNYNRNDGEGCKKCQTDFRNKEKFFKRNLEFPGWIRYLDFFETTPAKEIMIIGESPPQLKEQINIAFGLGYYPIERNGKLNFDQLKKTYSGEKELLEKIKNYQIKNNILWVYLNLLFSGKLDDIKHKIYITDLCKCYDHTKKDMWKKCLTECLIKEIELINPTLIVFQGWSSYKYVMEYLEKHGLIDSKREFYSNQLHFGKFPFKGKEINFFKIHHQAHFVQWHKGLEGNKIFDYTNQNRQFIKKKILKEVLNKNKLRKK